MRPPTSAELIAALVIAGEVQDNARLAHEVAELRGQLEDSDIENRVLRQLLSEALTSLHRLTEKVRRLDAIILALREELRHVRARMGVAV